MRRGEGAALAAKNKRLGIAHVEIGGILVIRPVPGIFGEPVVVQRPFRLPQEEVVEAQPPAGIHRVVAEVGNQAPLEQAGQILGPGQDRLRLFCRPGAALFGQGVDLVG